MRILAPKKIEKMHKEAFAARGKVYEDAINVALTTSTSLPVTLLIDLVMPSDKQNIINDLEAVKWHCSFESVGLHLEQDNAPRKYRLTINNKPMVDSEPHAPEEDPVIEQAVNGGDAFFEPEIAGTDPVELIVNRTEVPDPDEEVTEF